MKTTPQATEPPEREIERQRRRRLNRKRVTVAIMIPTLATLIYYLVIAPPQYQAYSEFMVAGSTSAAPDLLSSIGLVGPSQAGNDAKVVTDYAQSLPGVNQLRKFAKFNEAYSRFTIDPFSYLPPDATLEDAQDFWKRHSTISYDTITNVITLTVNAYTAEDAQRLAQGTLDAAGLVVNAMNQGARLTTTQAAQQTLERTKTEYLAAKRAVTQSRAARNQVIDTEASQSIGLVGSLDSQLAGLRAQEATNSATFQPGSPQLKAIEAQIAKVEALRAQAQNRAIGGPGTNATANDLADKAALMDLDYAQKAYYTALAAMQSTATQDASQRHYIQSFIPPHLPQKSDYFSRLWNVLAVALGSALVIGIGMLSFSVVKDHIQ